MYPLFLSMIDPHGAQFAIFAILIAALVIFMHRENIKRLLNRTESKFEFKKHGSREKKDQEKSWKVPFSLLIFDNEYGMIISLVWKSLILYKLEVSAWQSVTSAERV